MTTDPGRTDAPGEPDRRALLDALFANSREAVVIVDDDAVVRYATPGTAMLLGHDPDGAIGQPVFDFLHADDIDVAADLFVRRLDFEGSDQGKEIRIHHAAGHLLPVVATVSLLPDPSIGTCAITLRGATGSDAARELSFQRHIVVGDYVRKLGTDLMGAPAAALDRLGESLGEVGLLTGAEIVALCLERQHGPGVEILAGWRSASDEPIQLADPSPAIDDLFVSHLVADDLDDPRHQAIAELVAPIGATRLISTPFDTGERRGALMLARLGDSAAWWDTDSDLARGVANLAGRALHNAWSERLLTLTYRSGPIAFSIHTWSGEIVDCNDRFLRLFRLDSRESNPFTHPESLPLPSRRKLEKQVALIRSDRIQQIDLEMEAYRGDGSMIWVRVNGVRLAMPGSPDDVLLISYADITDRQRQRAELEYAANHDPLTEVGNRAAVMNRINELAEVNGALPALLVVDLDRFKHVNDSLGHPVGDHVLRTVAGRLKEGSRNMDLVARLGGDEFAVVLPNTSIAEAQAIADRLRECIEQPIDADGHELIQTVSIGIASGLNCTGPTDLMVRADRALYAAKHLGRNCHVVYDNSMHDEALVGVALERQLQQAIVRGELDVYFQPEFSIVDRTIVGAEALVRWHHPEQGLVPASKFIPAAERSGLIDEIGRFALRKAAENFVAICDTTHRDDLTLRVNISAREFARPELPDLVRSTLDQTGLAPHRLCLEMTETTLMDSPEVALSTFGILHEIGVQFAIDDFGTGYSSFAYLKRFPVDAVKIDRSFVRDLETDADSRAIVESIVQLAYAMAIDVVAEGVENERQFVLLRSMGCRLAQGFLVSKALSPKALVEFLDHHGRGIKSRYAIAGS